MTEDASDFAHARIGTVVGKKYTLARLIGSGGMASVYEAVHRNGHCVAIKMLHPSLSLDAQMCERFRREGYVANNVKHRGAVQVIDDDRADDGSVFLVMELLQGATLEKRRMLAGGCLPHREVCDLAQQLLDVLAAAHDRGITHRDVKPDNLFLTEDGALKVLDFGIARLEMANAVAVTRTGQTIGTPAFMPHEQALGKTGLIDGRTDLWAVGATMFTLMSGQYVHESESVTEMLVFAASRPARPVATVKPDVPPAIARVIDRALAFEREARWPDARAMAAALAEAYRVSYGMSIAGAPRVVVAETIGSGTELGRMSPMHGATGGSSASRAIRGASTTAGLAQTAADPNQRSGPVGGDAWRTGGPIAGNMAAGGGSPSAGRWSLQKASIPLLAAAIGVAATVGVSVLHRSPASSAAQSVPSAAVPASPPSVEIRAEGVAAPAAVAPPSPPSLPNSPANANVANANPAHAGASPPPVAPPIPIVKVPAFIPSPAAPAATTGPSPQASGHLCRTDPFTGRIEPARPGTTAGGEATFPCSRDPFTGAYKRER